MKTFVKTFFVAIVGIGFCTAIAVDSVSAADAEQTVKVRTAIMKELSGHTKKVKAYLKGDEDPKKAARLPKAGDVEFMAIQMASLAERLPEYFPKGTGSDEMGAKTRAKPAIWTDWEGFQAASKTLADEAKKLEEAAASGDKDKVSAVMKTLGKNGCGGCHQKFRGPKPKKSS